MDAATHAQLQQMDPQQRAMFLHNLQKQRQISLQRQMQVCVCVLIDNVKHCLFYSNILGPEVVTVFNFCSQYNICNIFLKFSHEAFN